jgi:hypothetical protein
MMITIMACALEMGSVNPDCSLVAVLLPKTYQSFQPATFGRQLLSWNSGALMVMLALDLLQYSL